MDFDCTLSPEELFTIHRDHNLIKIDCRFDLMNPSQGRLDYHNNHIPGAFYAHLDHDLASPVTPHTGRHPLPTQAAFSRTLSSWGWEQGKQIVVYDAAGGSIASRLWWLLNYYGIHRVAVLDGGIDQWIKQGFPVDNQVVDSSALPVPALVANVKMAVTTQEMITIQAAGQKRMIDARTPARFQGKIEPIDTVAGHIPGAINRFHALNLNERGLFKSSDDLNHEFDDLINGYTPENIIVYCGSGVTSCHHILALKKAGIEGVRLYVGSWSEWIRDPNRPIARS